jgi:HlyD family secretion protein
LFKGNRDNFVSQAEQLKLGVAQSDEEIRRNKRTRLASMEIRAPIAGIVNEVSVNTIGGIITPAKKLLTIVPQNARLQVEVANDELKKLGGKKLMPGMIVETFMPTESRTALSYLVKPFQDQIERAFRAR